MLGAVLLVAALTYLRCLGNGFVFDDQNLIVHNSAIGQWSFLWKSLTRDEYWFTNLGYVTRSRYRPLLLVWFWLNYHIFGLSPAGWHATAVAVHLVAVWMVFKVALRLTEDRQASLLAALLFALTPVHAQAVVWITALGVVFSTALGLAAFYLFTRRAEAWWRNWSAALALCAGSLLSHDSALVFPGLVSLYSFLYETDGPRAAPGPMSVWARIRGALLSGAPFAIEVLLYLVVRWLVLGFVVTGSAHPPNSLSNAQAMLTLPGVLVTYLVMLAVPWLAGPDHRVLVVQSPTSAWFYLPVAGLVALGGVFLVALRNHPRRRLYLFCAGWVGVALLPMMDLKVLYQLVSDTYLYLPSVGWCVLLGDWVVRFAPQERVRATRRLHGHGCTAGDLRGCALERAARLARRFDALQRIPSKRSLSRQIGECCSGSGSPSAAI
ncbi:MAG: hypothetical protein WA005_18905 [Candidatus Binataceae bacterium]